MTIALYGIPNCDTVKKARKWLDANQLDYQFHNFKKEGVTKEQLQRWIARHGWETVINRRGTSWRQLSEAERTSMNENAAIAAAIHNPSLIKRPVLEHEDGITIGFSAESYQALLDR